MNNLCLFLRPQTATLGDQEKQRQDIQNFIIPAIVQAQLTAIDDRTDGIEVFDISDAMIEKIYKADILIIDANRYETGGLFRFSPYLYYYMALGHSRGNATILVANSTEHLPQTLVRYHTLPYSSATVWEFTTRFANVVKRIREQRNSEPDNPLQEYLKQEALDKASQQVTEVKEDKTRQKPRRQPIIFYPVEPGSE